MKLATEVGLNPSYIVLDGEPAPPKKRQMGTQLPQKRGTAPNFQSMSVVAKWLDG